MAQPKSRRHSETLWLDDEALMDAVTALSGPGPAYLFLMAEAMAEAGRAQGLDAATADTLARATIAGAGALLAADRWPATELRKEVTSPGGTTEAALKVLMAEDGLVANIARLERYLRSYAPLLYAHAPGTLDIRGVLTAEFFFS